MAFDQLPKTWQVEVKGMRAECARLRVERRELRKQVAELTAALEAAGK